MRWSGICSAVFVLIVSCQTSSPRDEFEFRVEPGRSVLQICQRIHELKGPACSDLDRAAQDISDDLLFEPAPGDLPVQKRQIIHLVRFEGLFVPGEHSIIRGKDSIETARNILQTMLEKSRQRFQAMESSTGTRSEILTTDTRSQNLTLKEQMILASIVEKEAASNKNYEQVASVFLNRLNTRQALGSCPTVEYGLGYHRPFLLFKDLELQSRYNAYKRVGLPPTPIGAFSDGAFRAVLQPARDENIFFVFDWTTGNLHFAEKYSEHKRNAAMARANFIDRYGKSLMYRRFDDLYYEPIPEKSAPKDN